MPRTGDEGEWGDIGYKLEVDSGDLCAARGWSLLHAHIPHQVALLQYVQSFSVKDQKKKGITTRKVNTSGN